MKSRKKLSENVSKYASKILTNAFLWIYVVVSLYPLVYMLFISFKNNDEIFFTNPLGLPNPIRWENYYDAITRFNIGLFFKNSVVVSVISVFFILIISITFAYAAARMTWKGRKTAYLYMQLGLFIPLQIIMIPLAILVRDLGIRNTYFSLIIPYIAFNLSFSILIFYSFFRSIPKEMEESAFVEGASIYQTFFHIIIPIVRPAIATVTIFAFLNVWNEYIMAQVLNSDQKLKTLPVGLLSFTGQFGTDWGPMGAAMVLASVPTIVLYLIMSKKVENSVTIGGAVK